MRRGDGLGLHSADVDRGEGRLVVRPGPGGSRRAGFISLDPEAVAALYLQQAPPDDEPNPRVSAAPGG
ncbi:hypothetical protein NUM3379_01410 [Kineococcus sp. NUM-3379]